MKTKKPVNRAPEARLHVILARKAPIGVIFRRGPSKWVQLVKWHVNTGEFQEGQWFHGRVYERRCDLSPDGSKLIYFASKFGGRGARASSYTYAWTAISELPYFTALALWPKGDCWHGGGLFESDRKVWLNHKPEVAIPHPEHMPPKGLRVQPNPDAHGEDGPVWNRRMQRDGWVLIQEGVFPFTFKKGWKTERPEIWERDRPTDGIKLRRTLERIDFEVAGGPYIESFVLALKDGSESPLKGANWADWDQKGRLVFARDGRLFMSKVSTESILEVQLINLNRNKPEPIETPDWAKRWRW